jgi:colanic acid/amylovoran biosynthesis protein
MAKSKTIAIIGGSVWGNRGAEAMLVTTLGKIQANFPDAYFVVFTPYPQKDRALVPDKNLDFFDSRPKALVIHTMAALLFWGAKKIGLSFKLTGAMEAVHKADVLLDIGGITFADGRLIFLPYNILTIWPAMLVGTPVIKLSQAAGSFKNPVIRSLAKIFLSRCLFVFGRGEKTCSYLEQLGLQKSKFSLATDIAFSYKPEYSRSHENELAVHQLSEKMAIIRRQGNRIISIAPSMLVLEKSNSNRINYNQAMLELVKHVDIPNTYYIVFPNASRERSKKTRNNDIHAVSAMRMQAKILLPRSLYKRFFWVDFDMNSKGIRMIASLSDVLITSRFHAMVSGLALSVPTLVIGWGHKYLEAMKAFGLERFVVDYQDQSQDLAGMLKELLDNNAEYRARMGANLPAVIESTNDQFEYLRNLLEK